MGEWRETRQKSGREVCSISSLVSLSQRLDSLQIPNEKASRHLFALHGRWAEEDEKHSPRQGL